jgi:DNA-binding NtrC family response regulator
MSDLVGTSDAHRRTLARVAAAATNDAEVLIIGPSGVGKELYARMIHQQSRRAAGPFVGVNCGAIPTELFENEMFGHVSGAFTGARPNRGGLVREAERGTLFLDEVDSLHLANQVKLLRLIQEREYRPLGEARTRKVDLRVVAASNTDLTTEAFAGRFRQDLFFRLRVIPIEVPPLCERQEDVAPLLAHFLSRYALEYGSKPVTLSVKASVRLDAYRWPGNVRELENCARYLVCTHPGETIGPDDLPLLTLEPVEAHAPRNFQSAKREVVRTFERKFLEETLARYDGNIAAAARASGKHRRAFFELMRRHGLTTRQPPTGAHGSEAKRAGARGVLPSARAADHSASQASEPPPCSSSVELARSPRLAAEAGPLSGRPRSRSGRNAMGSEATSFAEARPA